MKHLDLTYKILLAEDDSDDVDFFEIALNDLQIAYELKTVKNAKNLFAAMASCSPDILFIDLEMPERGGLECVVAIRENQTYCNMPIVIYSSHCYEELVTEAFKRGANLFIKKANCIQKIAQQIEQSLKMDWDQNMNFPSYREFLVT